MPFPSLTLTTVVLPLQLRNKRRPDLLLGCGQRCSAAPEPFRVVISSIWRSTNLRRSTCTRTLGPDGSLTEIIHLDGSGRDLTEEQLEEFIRRLPIQPAGWTIAKLNPVDAWTGPPAIVNCGP
jgi:hypothetical protein